MQISNLINDRNSLVGGHNSLNYCDVISIDNLLSAWQEFCRGKKTKMDVARYELNLERNIFELRKILLHGEWKPDPYQIFFVRDPKLREIHKASVRDRVLYQAVYSQLYQVFDKHFIFDSYSSRKKKGTHNGIKRLARFSNRISNNHTSAGYILKCDIKKFFDSIDQRILLDLIAKKITDEKLFSLISKMIISFEKTPGKGLPLGNVTSQLFANIYLNELDQFVKHKLKAKYYARYCDDFFIGNNSLEYLKYCLLEVEEFCNKELLLEFHQRKVILCKISSGTDFLGYVNLPYRKILRTRTKQRVLRKISKLKLSYDKKEVSKEDLKHSIQSYLGLLSHCKGEKIKEKIVKIIGKDIISP